MRPLDRIDFEIVTALQQDARISNKDLAARIGLSPSACLERVRALEERGVFVGFHAKVDPAALGIGLQALIAVRLRVHSRETVDAFRDHAVGLPEVLAVSHVTGGEDFLVRVAARDTDHLRDIALAHFTTRPEVARIHTSLIYEHVESHAWPHFVANGDAGR